MVEISKVYVPSTVDPISWSMIEIKPNVVKSLSTLCPPADGMSWWYTCANVILVGEGLVSLCLVIPKYTIKVSHDVVSIQQKLTTVEVDLCE